MQRGQVGDGRFGMVGQRLVVRDWSHLDFTGVPFVSKPAYRLLTAEALKSRFDLRQVCTVRHPLETMLEILSSRPDKPSSTDREFVLTIATHRSGSLAAILVTSRNPDAEP